MNLDKKQIIGVCIILFLIIAVGTYWIALLCDKINILEQSKAMLEEKAVMSSEFENYFANELKTKSHIPVMLSKYFIYEYNYKKEQSENSQGVLGAIYSINASYFDDGKKNISIFCPEFNVSVKRQIVTDKKYPISTDLVLLIPNKIINFSQTYLCTLMVDDKKYALNTSYLNS